MELRTNDSVCCERLHFIPFFLKFVRFIDDCPFVLAFKRPLFLVPCEFQSNVFLTISLAGSFTVCLAHFYFLINTFIYSLFAALHSTSFLLTFGQNILSMPLRQLLTETWVVIFQVSKPYSNVKIKF